MSLRDWLIYLNELLKTIAWPTIVLIAFLLLKQQIMDFLGNVKEAELPGGIKLKTIDREIKKAEIIKEEIMSETKNEDKAKPKRPSFNANAEMVKHGLDPSPSNLDMSFYTKILEQDPSIALAGLRIDLEIMVKNLAKGFDIDLRNSRSIDQTLTLLLNRSAITVNQYKLINTINNICTAAIHGEKITKQQAVQVFEIAPLLIDDYISWLDWGFAKK